MAGSWRRRPVGAVLVAATGANGKEGRWSMPEDGAMAADNWREAVMAAEILDWPPVLPSHLLGSDSLLSPVSIAFWISLG